MAQVASVAPTPLADSLFISLASFQFHIISETAIVPLLTYDVLPAPKEAVRAFFAEPSSAAPLPPPPPPQSAAGAGPQAKAPAAPTSLGVEFNFDPSAASTQ